MVFFHPRGSFCSSSRRQQEEKISYKHPFLWVSEVYIREFLGAIVMLPPTPADARGSAPGNKTFGCLCSISSTR